MRSLSNSSSLLARIAAGIEAAMPLPLIRPRRRAGSLDDHANADAGIVDMPGHGPIVDALAGELGHAPIEAQPARLAKWPASITYRQTKDRPKAASQFRPILCVHMRYDTSNSTATPAGSRMNNHQTICPHSKIQTAASVISYPSKLMNVDQAAINAGFDLRR